MNGPEPLGPGCAITLEETRRMSVPVQAHYGIYRNPKSEGAEVGIARFVYNCPVRAMEAWLRASRITYGAVFRQLTAAGTIEDRLTGNGVWKNRRRRAALARLISGFALPNLPKVSH